MASNISNVKPGNKIPYGGSGNPGQGGARLTPQEQWRLNQAQGKSNDWHGPADNINTYPLKIDPNDPNWMNIPGALKDKARDNAIGNLVGYTPGQNYPGVKGPGYPPMQGGTVDPDRASSFAGGGFVNKPKQPTLADLLASFGAAGNKIVPY